MKAMVRVAMALLLMVPALAQAQVQEDPNRIPPSRDPKRTANGLALTPPMGWNSWNKFACNIDEKVVRGWPTRSFPAG